MKIVAVAVADVRPVFDVLFGVLAIGVTPPFDETPAGVDPPPPPHAASVTIRPIAPSLDAPFIIEHSAYGC
jgi:hypothetical protein